MAPPAVEGADADADADEVEADVDDQGSEEEAASSPSFADILGPDCVIQRMDKDRKVQGTAKPDEMQHELMTRASTQKRIGACAEHVKNMSREEKLSWALELKDRANVFYTSCNFEEAAKLYNDCLVAMDFGDSEAEKREVQRKLQLPVCTNLAACMIEMGLYVRCIEMCDIALSIEPDSSKAVYRRGLAHYRLGDHESARPDLEKALRLIDAQASEMPEAGGEDDARSRDDLRRRVLAYLVHIRSFSQKERTACRRVFERVADEPLYADRANPSEEAPQIDDSDEAIDAALQRIRRNDWRCCPCRRREKDD